MGPMQRMPGMNTAVDYAPRRLPQQAMDNANANAAFNRPQMLPQQAMTNANPNAAFNQNPAGMQPTPMANPMPPQMGQMPGMMGNGMTGQQQPRYLADLAPRRF